MSKYKVCYFPFYGKGEYTRVALTVAKADWKDKIV
jgi:hypothetical protein